MGDNSFDETGGRQAYLRRLAVQLAGQLPDDRESALAVLENMQSLVEGYLYPPPDDDPRNNVRKFSRVRLVKPNPDATGE